MRVVSFKPNQITKSVLAELAGRSKDVLEKRYGLTGERKKTLEAIGDEYSITRERVRQIENLAKQQVRESQRFAEKAYEAVTELKEIIDEMGGIAEEKNLLSYVAAREADQNHLYLLLELGEPFIFEKEDTDHKRSWHTKRNNKTVIKDSLKKLYKDLDTDEILTEEQIIERFMNIIEHDLLDGVADTRIAKEWLKISKLVDKNQMGKWGRTDSPNISTRGVRDYAYLVLREHGKPMHFREIAEITSQHFGKKTNVATIHNELIKDDRFSLVGRGLYALKDWGLYGGTVADLITEILVENKKPMSEDEIIERVLEKKLVKESTVIINLKNKKRFQQDKATRLYSLVK